MTSPTPQPQEANSPPPPTPSISITLALSSSTYSYSTDPTPVISIHITSHTPRPVTVFTRNTVLDPASGLKRQCFTITDTSTGKPVHQNKVSVNRPPIRRQLGSPDEQLFLTLSPSQPTAVVEAPFGPPDGQAKPAGHPDRFPRPAWGVDGLEVGKEYEVGVAGGQGLEWWRWGTKEEVLAQPGGLDDWYLGEAEGEGIVIDVEGTSGVRFGIEA